MAASTTETGPGVNPDALTADLEALAPSPQNGHACQAGGALSTIPEDKRPIIEALIDRPDLSATDICNVLARHGLTVRTPNLARHRRRGGPNGCKCPPKASEATT